MSGTMIKLCGMRRLQDIQAVDQIMPDLVGFIFFPKSHRYVTGEQAAVLKAALDPRIKAVGVFVDAEVQHVADLLNSGVIDMAQLHGHEDHEYIARLRSLTDKPIIQAFRVKEQADIRRALESKADHILLDSGASSGEAFDWSLLKDVPRPFFLAGGLDPDNVSAAIAQIHPWAVDVSSGIETDGFKAAHKMAAFVRNARAAE